MDYNQLTKAELIEKLNEQKHLASAVEAKDREISEIVQKHESKVKQLLKELEDMKKEYQGSLKKEEVEKLVKSAEDRSGESIKIAQFYVKMYHDFLKQTQQNLEMALFTEQVVSEKFKK